MRDLGHPLATGRTADVYARGPERVLKLMRPEFGAEQAHAEAAAARLAAEAGIGAPEFHGLVTVGEQVGLEYERLDGPSMLEVLAADPEAVERLAAELGTVHAAMHAVETTALPDVRGVLSRDIGHADVGPAVRAAAMRRLETLPAGVALLHGDMHPGNVILTAQGPRTIDWIQASRGAPAADVARTLFLLRDSELDPGLPGAMRPAIGERRARFAAAYLDAYRSARRLDLSDVARWRLPILVARAAEGVRPERPTLDGLIAAELEAAGGIGPA